VYGDELTQAESMAQGVIAGNVRANEHGGDVGRHTSQTGPLAGSGGQDHHRLSTPSETRQSKDGLFGEPRPLGRPLEPESYVPPRSPPLLPCPPQSDPVQTGWDLKPDRLLGESPSI
jgi:hypothetical protein